VVTELEGDEVAPETIDSAAEPPNR
jgi:hypothetical protein